MEEIKLPNHNPLVAPNSNVFASLLEIKLTVQLNLAMLSFSFSDPLDKLLVKSNINWQNNC